MTGSRSGGVRAERGAPEPVSHRIIETVATRSDVEIDELPRLYDVIDPELLDGLFAADSDHLDGYVEFAYAGYRVTVEAGGGVEIESRD